MDPQNNEQQQQQQQQEQPAQDAGSGFQDRINALTGKWRSTERERDAAIADSNQLAERVQQLESQLQPQAPEAQTGPFRQESMKSTPTGDQPSDIASLVDAAVQKSLAPLLQQQQTQALRAEQELLFNEAIEAIGDDITSQDSPTGKLTREILQGNPALADLPNGPTLAAYAAYAASVLQNGGNNANQDARKMAASSPQPAGNRLSDLPDPSTATQEFLEQWQQKAANREPASEEEIRDLIGVKMGRAQVRKT